MVRSTSLRLAALYTAAFGLSVVVLGAITWLTIGATLNRQFDVRINAEASALAQEFRIEGLSGVVQAVRERDRIPGALHYGLIGPGGEPVAGRLAALKSPPGWSTVQMAGQRGGAESVRLLTIALPEGYRLVVGDDDDQSDAVQQTVLQGFAWAFAGVVVLGILGGYGLSRDMHRRLAGMTGAAEGVIADGDLSRRIPVRGSDDDLDRLAATFNRMLDRIAALMESLRQVSSDIAHDLRTPLTRLRQRLEASQRLATDKHRDVVAGALGDVDAILDTFAALLRIAQIEGGARRAAFRQTDLAGVARTVVEAFAPSAEDGGQRLSLEGDEPLLVEGDPELLTQMLVNLVENALRHAGPRAQVRVRAARHGAGAEVSVIDDGPGVPPGERERIFDRFYRLERSRTTPGDGLGLALVAAVARLHGASVALADAGPGLIVRVTFRAAQAPHIGVSQCP